MHFGIKCGLIIFYFFAKYKKHKENPATVKHGEEGAIALWCYLSTSGAENAVGLEGRKDSIKYKQILEANTPQSVKKLKKNWTLH